MRNHICKQGKSVPISKRNQIHLTSIDIRAAFMRETRKTYANKKIKFIPPHKGVNVTATVIKDTVQKKQDTLRHFFLHFNSVTSEAWGE